MSGRYICRICKQPKSKSAMSKGYHRCKACVKDKSRGVREMEALKKICEEISE